MIKGWKALEKLKREQKKKEKDKIKKVKKKEIIPVDDSEVELDEELVSLKKELEKVSSSLSQELHYCS